MLHLNLELYPRSAETYFWLAQVELANGNQTQAREMPSEALDCDAAHERARRLLDRLGK